MSAGQLSRSELTAAAGVDPWLLAERLVTGNPAVIENEAARLFRLADEATAAAEAQRRAGVHRLSGYRNSSAIAGDTDGAPAPTGSGAAASRWLDQARDRLPLAARLLQAVAADLGSTQAGAAAELAELDSTLAVLRSAARSTALTAHLPDSDLAADEAQRRRHAVQAVRVHGSTIQRLIDGYDATLATAARRLADLRAGPGLTAAPWLGLASAVPAATASPATAIAWWAGLTPAEQQAALESDFDSIGRLHGLPAAVLDLANRRRIEHFLASTVLKPDSEEHDSEQPWLGLAGPVVGIAAGWIAATRDNAVSLSARRQAAQALLDAAETPGESRYILSWEIDAATRMPGAMLAIGNPDTARNTAVLVPGTTNSLATIGELTRTATRVDGAMGTASKAVVIWVDGPIPPTLPAASLDRFAERSGPLLTADLAGLRAAQTAATGGSAHLTAIGHSYGSYTLGTALTGGAHRYVDDAVFVGSPGVGVGDAGDLGMDPDHVWSGQTGDDPILGVQHRFTPGAVGSNPQQAEFGDRHFSVAGSSGHGEYFQGESLANIGHIAGGAAGRVHEIAAPDFHTWYQALQDGVDVPLVPAQTVGTVAGDLFEGDLTGAAVDSVSGGMGALGAVEDTACDISPLC